MAKTKVVLGKPKPGEERKLTKGEAEYVGFHCHERYFVGTDKKTKKTVIGFTTNPKRKRGDALVIPTPHHFRKLEAYWGLCQDPDDEFLESLGERERQQLLAFVQHWRRALNVI